MTDKQTPPDWVLLEAGSFFYDNEGLFRVFCDMIERHEPPHADRRLLCAREAIREIPLDTEVKTESICVRSIELWEEGFGK
jgi:hypothetical protein